MIAATAWLVSAAAGLICASSWFAPYPAALVQLSVAVLGGGLLAVTAVAWRTSREAEASFTEAARASARTAWGWVWMWF